MQNMPKAPLADQMRPKDLSEFVGQEKLAGKNGVITKLLKNAGKTDFFPSIVFWGPPGSGKTTLARIIANELTRPFHEFSAVSTSVKDIEKIIKQSSKGNQPGLFPPVVFIDEIHRFNKAQQDKLLPYVENGTIIFIGATTENPSFEIIGPLLSRTRVLILDRLSEKDLNTIAKRAVKELKARIGKRANEFLIASSNGDARVLLNVVEIAAHLSPSQSISLKGIEEALQKEQFMFDKRGEEYYNVISAFIKSMRASNADAALYYLARMVEAGQDPLYIARRMVIFASEDVGMAQPTAIVVANEVFKACETIGYPECAINLAHGTVYLAKAKKDRSAYEAYFKAVDDVKKHGNLPVPMNLRNPVTKLMENVGYGKGYKKYTKEDLLPEKLKGKKYY
jgi:putative ATPase